MQQDLVLRNRNKGQMKEVDEAICRRLRLRMCTLWAFVWTFLPYQYFPHCPHITQGWKLVVVARRDKKNDIPAPPPQYPCYVVMFFSFSLVPFSPGQELLTRNLVPLCSGLICIPSGCLPWDNVPSRMAEVPSLCALTAMSLVGLAFVRYHLFLASVFLPRPPLSASHRFSFKVHRQLFKNMAIPQGNTENQQHPTLLILVLPTPNIFTCNNVSLFPLFLIILHSNFTAQGCSYGARYHLLFMVLLPQSSIN